MWANRSKCKLTGDSDCGYILKMFVLTPDNHICLTRLGQTKAEGSANREAFLLLNQLHA